MVEISDIRDRESLRAWLEGQPQRFSVVIAHRAAMRVLPEYWQWVQTSERARNSDLLALPVLWPNLISGVVAFCPTPEIKAELRLAAARAARAAYAADAAADTAAAAYAADAAIWKIIRSDCKLLLEGKPLSHVAVWGAGSNPLQAKWADTKHALAADTVDWGFWIKWYDAALEGKPLPYALLERIALEVKEEDWKQGPKHVNGLIAGIEADFKEETPEIQVPPSQILVQNQSVIEAQLDTLVQLVTQEMNRLRGQNDFTEAEGELIAARVSVLKDILAAVEKIRAALEANEPSTALTVMDEQLPEVFDSAEKLKELRPEEVLSETVIAMGVAVKYLTECGMSSADATKVAMGDMAVKKTKGWLGRKK